MGLKPGVAHLAVMSLLPTNLLTIPLFKEPDVLVAMSQEAYDKFHTSVKTDALILIDNGLVDANNQGTVCGIPCTDLAESLGRRIVANVVMLGFFTVVTKIVSRSAMEEAITASVKAKTVPLNIRAFEAGCQFALDKEYVQ